MNRFKSKNKPVAILLLALFALVVLGACQPAPTPTAAPTVAPTLAPTTAPMVVPTPPLTVAPTKAPTVAPTAAATATQAARVAPGDLIPRRTLFLLTDKRDVAFSRDGKYISYSAPFEGSMNVWVMAGNDPKTEKVLTNHKGGIESYYWPYNPNYVLYRQDNRGDENYVIYSANITTGITQTLTPRTARAGVQRISPKFPNEILITLNERDPKAPDVYRLNIETGEKKMVLQNDNYASYLTDEDLTIRFASRVNPDGSREWFKQVSPGKWESFIKIGLEDESNTRPLHLYRDGKALYLEDSRGRNTGALASIDLQTGALTTIAEDPRADISGYTAHPTTNEIQAVAFTYDIKRWTVLDQSLVDDFKYLESVAAGELEILSRSVDDKRWMVSYTMDNGPVRFYVYDREAKKATYMFPDRNSLEGLPLAKMHPLIIKARDGLEMVSYLTLPMESNPDGRPKPSKPLPMVLLVHGGPWSRDWWGYSRNHQLYANRGYAVLSVNFRGSDGFGKNFLSAGNLEWGGKMQDDLIDAVNWAIKENVADAKKVCIMGGSYGGYAALIGLTFTPDVFACAVDMYGRADLTSIVEDPALSRITTLDLWKRRVGDPSTEEGRKFLLSRSAITFVDKIKKPLLVIQGGNDPRVKSTQAELIVKAMQDRKMPVTYLFYPNEGHGFSSASNSRSASMVIEAFFAMHLGGRMQPFGDDMTGSTIQVKTGLELIPGLADALPKK
jgi:dipeptidyl aminopeptidase/acylaminoacyl peptidase